MKKQSASIVRIAEEILKAEKRPLHYRVITKRLLNQHRLHGLTPHETVRSRLGTDERFKRVAEGMYALAEWDEYPTARFAKDIAYDVLKSRRRPMSLTALGIAILKERNFVGGADQVARNVIRTDKRFAYDPDTRLVALAKWKKK